MRVSILTLFIFFISQQSHADLFKCRGIPKYNWAYYKGVFKQIKKNSKKRDVSNNIHYFLKSYKQDCLDKKSIKKLSSEMDKFRKTGYESEEKFLKEEILHAARYRYPIEKIKKLEKLLQKSEREVPAKFSTKLKEENKKNNARITSIKNSCTPVNNRKAPLTKRARHQDGTGWCYAYAASDLLSHKTGKNISSFDVANSNNNSKSLFTSFQFMFSSDETDKNGGFIDKAVKHAMKRGLCEESDLRSEFITQEHSHFVNILKTLEHIKKNFDDKTKIVNPDPFAILNDDSKEYRPTAKDLKKQEENITDFLGDCSILKGPWFSLFKNLNKADIVEVLKKSERDEFIHNLVQKNCKKRIQVKEKFKVVTNGGTIFKTDPAKLIKTIDEQLNNDNIVGFSYFASFLADPRDNLDGRHASTIVGRKMDKKTGSCLYLIRNSWGMCNDSYKGAVSCKDGHQWVQQEELEKAIYATTHLE